MTLFLELIAVAVLILLNGYFVAAEYGLVTVRRTRIAELAQQEQNRRAKQVLLITESPPRFIAAMQLGVTLTSLAIGALGEQAFAEVFDPFLATGSPSSSRTSILTFFHVVIGELVPKAVALRYSERVALAVSTPVRIFFVVFAPADLAAPALDGVAAPAVRPAAARRRGNRALRGRAEDARQRVDGARRDRGRASRRCSTRSSTSPTRRSRT